MLNTKITASLVSEAEWEVLRIIWTLGKVHTSDVIKQLQAKKGWSESTIKTLMRRLENKKMLSVDKKGHRFTYMANVSQSEMMYNIMRKSLDNMCDVPKGKVMLKLLEDMPLSKSDIDDICNVLQKKRSSSPEKISCNCLVKCEVGNDC